LSPRTARRHVELLLSCRGLSRTSSNFRSIRDYIFADHTPAEKNQVLFCADRPVRASGRQPWILMTHTSSSGPETRPTRVVASVQMKSSASGGRVVVSDFGRPIVLKQTCRSVLARRETRRPAE
jgi:hypothetical protein